MSRIFYFVDEIVTPFVAEDIRRISLEYDNVYLFSVNELQGKEALPKNVEVFEEFVDWKQFKPLQIVSKNLFSILCIYISESWILKKFLPFKKTIALISSNIFKAEQILDIVRTLRLRSGYKLTSVNSVIDTQKKVTSQSLSKPTPRSLSVVEAPAYYSFWFYDCIYLAWMKKKGWIEKAVTRAHGGDLFEERGSLNGKILLRNFQTKYLDAVLSVSDEGTRYLQNKYPRAINKIKTVFLGSQDAGENPFDTTGFTIVSCARVRDIKRIHKIAEMLQFVSFPITWIHIGSENLEAKNDPTISIYLKNKEKLNQNPNVTVVTQGLMNNQEVLNLYKNTPINLFISLSEAEGIPVSMMEAISFGIPILSTDVGGCKEIVNEKTGVLIPLETSMEEVAEIITEFKNSSKNTIEFRKGVREFWEEYFDADKNYGKLFEEIVG